MSLSATYDRLVAGAIPFAAWQCGSIVDLNLRDQDLHVFPGSFNPIHAGHQAIMAHMRLAVGATCFYELSLHRRGKEPLPLDVLRTRLNQFEGQDLVLITNADFFARKAAALAECRSLTFHLGFDTAKRLLADDGREGVEAIPATFVVYPRDGLNLENLETRPRNMQAGPDLPQAHNLSSTRIREEIRRTQQEP